MTVPFIHDETDTWDGLSLGGTQVDGLCDVKIDRAKKLDIKSAGGSDGATITDQGYEPAKVTISIRVWTADQWTSLQGLIELIEPAPAKKPAAPLLIAHPAATVRKVKAVSIKSVKGPDIGSDGATTIVLECIEWFPPPKKNVTNTASGPQTRLDATGRDRNPADHGVHPQKGVIYTEDGAFDNHVDLLHHYVNKNPPEYKDLDSWGDKS